MQPNSIRAGAVFASLLLAAAHALGAAQVSPGTPSRKIGRDKSDLPRGYPGAKIHRAFAQKRATMRGGAHL